MDDRLVGLAESLAGCREIAWWALSPTDLIDTVDLLHTLTQQLAGLQLAALAQLDAQGVGVAQGATSTAAWLRDRHRISPGAAHRAVRLATALHGDCVETGEALAAGVLNVEQARLIAAAVDTVPAEVKAKAETHLVEQAAAFGPKELGRLAERIVEVVAPQVADQLAESQLERAERRAYLDREFTVTDLPGTNRVRLHGFLDREDAAHLRAALDPLTRPQSTKDVPDDRTAGQRRADALVEISRLVLTCRKLPRDGGERPQVVVTMDLDKLQTQTAAATLDDGGQLSPAALRRLACDAQIVPAILDGKGQVLDVGRERRLFTGSLRRALVLRDKGCAFPGCDRPPRWTEAHHAIHWLDWGVTALHNGVLLCRWHHRLIHRGDWQVHIKNGHPIFIPPAYIDKTREPIPANHRRRQ